MTHRPSTHIAAAALVAFASLAIGQAQAQFIPYFGKNNPKYDSFQWRVYKSPHFEVYYYPEFEQHLARLVSYAESSYQKVSSDLKHELSFPIPLILYKTHSEYEQTNLAPVYATQASGAFTESVRNRMVVPIDEPPDKLQGLITHELTHVFENDLIPSSFIGRGAPLWITEGLADFERGIWDPIDIMMVRDAAVTDQVPKMSRTDYQPLSGRIAYQLGHAVFEYIEAKYGKEGIRQFLYTIRKNIVGGGVDDIYHQAFRTKPEEFDEGFEKWLKERFKPYRDKQRPSDYGRDLSPDEEKTRFQGVYAFAASPSGEMVAALSPNRGEGELDLTLLSTKDRSVIKNLTAGYTGEWESIELGDDFVAGRALAFDPRGETVAFLARTGKRRSLILISTTTGKVVKKIPLELDQASSPSLLPNGRHALISALKDGVADIYLVDLEEGSVKNLTQDAFFDGNPQISPDGNLVVYNRRVSGHNKIYAFPLANPARKTQLTFGAHEDMAPAFSADGERVYYSSNEDDDIFNVRSLDLKTGIVRQYTDALGGNMTPVPLAGKGTERVAFITYFKGDFRLHSIEAGEPLKEVEQDVRAADEDIVDFQPDLVHQVVPQNKRRKKLFEKLYLEGRPPLNVGVTSGGDFFGGSQVALSDVLGDQNFVFTALSVREFRTYEGTYINLANRFQYGLSMFDYTSFFYPTFFVPFRSFSREGAFATQRYTGATLTGAYPLDRFRRVQVSGGVVRLREQYEDPAIEAFIQDQAEAAGVRYIFNNGNVAPLEVSLVQETTRFAEFGPLSGSTFSVGFTVAPGIGSFLSRRTLDADLRKYFRLGTSSVVFATRFRGFRSSGEHPDFFYFGGGMELRGYNYYSFVGHEGFFANAELRFPLIDVARTPIGLIGPVRGTLFGGIGSARYKDVPYRFSSSADDLSFVNCETTNCIPEPVSGFHLVDGRASFGVGLQLFFLGYPLHFDWTKITDLKVVSRNTRFDFWVGFDF